MIRDLGWTRLKAAGTSSLPSPKTVIVSGLAPSSARLAALAIHEAQAAWLAHLERTREPVHRGEDGLSAVYCFGRCP